MALLYDDRDCAPITQIELDMAIKKHGMFTAGRVGGARALLTHRNFSRLDFRGANLSGADFSGSLFYRANLSGCHLDGAVFFVTNLQKADLTNASMVRADLRGANLAGANLTGTNLTSADMREGAMATKDRSGNINLVLQAAIKNEIETSKKPAGGSFTEYVNASEALFLNARMNRVFLRGANLTGAVLENADLTGAQMQGAKLVNTLLSGAKMTGVDLSTVNLQGALRDDIQGLSLDDVGQPFSVLTEQHKAWIDSHGATGARLDFTRYDLRPHGVNHAQFDGGFLPMMKARQGIFSRMTFNHAALQAADLREGDFRLCVFDDADLRGTDFSGSNMMRARFRRADLSALILPAGRKKPLDFSYCNLRHADFRDANLKDANLKGADVTEADFTGANLEGVEIGPGA